MLRGTLLRIKGTPDNHHDVDMLERHGRLWIYRHGSLGSTVTVKSLATGMVWTWHGYDLEEDTNGQEG